MKLLLNFMLKIIIKKQEVKTMIICILHTGETGRDII